MAVQNQKNKKKSKLGLGWLIFILAMYLVPRLMEGLDSADFSSFMRRLRLQFLIWEHQLGLPLPTLLAVGVLCVVLLAVILRTARKKAMETKEDRPTRAPRTSAAVQRPDPRAKSFTEPDAYCFTCEATGEDHFQRDKLTRIRQLEEWLKNGLIDREEYKVLKARYEQDL